MWCTILQRKKKEVSFIAQTTHGNILLSSLLALPWFHQSFGRGADLRPMLLKNTWHMPSLYASRCSWAITMASLVISSVNGCCLVYDSLLRPLESSFDELLWHWWHHTPKSQYLRYFRTINIRIIFTIVIVSGIIYRQNSCYKKKENIINIVNVLVYLLSSRILPWGLSVPFIPECQYDLGTLKNNCAHKSRCVTQNDGRMKSQCNGRGRFCKTELKHCLKLSGPHFVEWKSESSQDSHI